MPKYYSPILEGKRPSAPTAWTKTTISQSQAQAQGLAPKTTQMISYDLTWHHNIPWSTLRDSWNIIFTFCDIAIVYDLFELYARGNGTCADPHKLKMKLHELRLAIGPNASNASSATYQSWVERFGDDVNTGTSLLPNASTDSQLDYSDWDDLNSIVAWQSWNIVEGPKESVRTDDPGDQAFDDFRKADPKNLNRYSLVYSLYTALGKLIADFNTVKSGSCDMKKVDKWNAALETAVDAAVGLRFAPKIMFDASMWKQVATHKNTTTATQNNMAVFWMAKAP